MKFRRAELHNHSTESDGTMSVAELIDYAVEHRFETLALTDHNTYSGHRKVAGALAGKPLDVILGVETTTFFGHILCLGYGAGSDWMSLNPYAPEGLLKYLKHQGALIGLAHPMCIGEPISVGCRCTMKIHDYSLLDYIEVVNTAAGDTLMGNAQALALWEELLFKGYRLAAVTGKDIHQPPARLENLFTTFAQVDEETDNADGVLQAIRTQKTIISKGPLPYVAAQEGDTVQIQVDNTNPYDSWPEKLGGIAPVMELVTGPGQSQISREPWNAPFTFQIPASCRCLLVKLYDGTCDYRHLLAVSAPFYPGEAQL